MIIMRVMIRSRGAAMSMNTAMNILTITATITVMKATEA